MKKIEKKDFSFVCKKKFSELEGKSEFKRFCSECSLHVHNLAMYSEAGAKKLAEEAKVSGGRLCVAVGPTGLGYQSCVGKLEEEDSDSGFFVGEIVPEYFEDEK